MSKYPMSHVLMEKKCLDTGVRITLVWVTGDPHPKKLHINRKFRENIGVKNRKNHENYYL